MHPAPPPQVAPDELPEGRSAGRPPEPVQEPQRLMGHDDNLEQRACAQGAERDSVGGEQKKGAKAGAGKRL